MRTYLSFNIIILLLLSSCIFDPSDKTDIVENHESIIIKSGSSFGFCVGYCSLEITITETFTEYVSSSWDTLNYPTKTKDLSTNENEWSSLVNNLNFTIFEQLDDVIGCPDCADGGSEWIEVIMKDKRKKVTFEYGDSLEGMNKLLTQLRIIRNRYSEIDDNNKSIVYSNSFESISDTAGWTGISNNMFVSDPAPNSGEQSLLIGGGCIQPTASLELLNLLPNSYYISFWGKIEDENQNGAITISNKSNQELLSATVDQSEWKKFELGPILIGPNFPLKIDIVIGGIIYAEMFIDNLEVYTID